MTVSTDAYLVFGIQLGDAEDITSDVIQKRYDEEDPGDYLPYLPEVVDEILGKQHAVMMKLHCSCDYMMYTLVVKDSVKYASRGSPVEVSPADLAPRPEWEETLKDACEKLGLEFEPPKWWLQSLWC